ncbi:hypothetical protein BV25DRAFT_1912792 [Artomyces pyxidatus]|uniref:Uncharacterized protein n=1 Tax=Artomyces pyxidatus TaxID=48021 RepID=A0ACB8TEF7_9AGAM|nr:hypothetical protein BV25DRAFT_1912792 [Artomyces pyxidatus]
MSQDNRATSMTTRNASSRSSTPRPGETFAKLEAKLSTGIKTVKSAREHLAKYSLSIEDEPYTLETLRCILLHIAQLAKVPSPVVSAIHSVGILLGNLDDDERSTRLASTLSEKLDEILEEKLADVTERLAVVATSLDGNTAAFHTMLSDLKDTNDTQKDLLGDIQSSVTKVSDSTSQLTTTASTYRDALLNSAKTSPQPSPLLDPRVARQVITRACQVLIEETESSTLLESTAAIRISTSAKLLISTI